MAAYVGNSDDEPGRRSRIKTDYTLGMFVNVQSVKDFATCISVPVKAIALAQPTGKTCSSKERTTNIYICLDIYFKPAKMLPISNLSYKVIEN